MKKFTAIKKVSALLLTLAILVLAIPVCFAAQNVSLTVTGDPVSGQYRLRGWLTDGNTSFSVMVFKASKPNEVSYIGYGSVGKNGSISHDFYLPSAAAGGTYRVKVCGDAMTTAENTAFTHSKKTLSDTAALVDPENGCVLYSDDLSGFSVYCYSADAASYEITFSENNAAVCSASFSANAAERTVKPIVLSNLTKGVHTLYYTIKKDGTEVSSGTKTVAVIERYKGNYRDGDASYGVHTSFVSDRTDNEKELELLSRAGLSKVRVGNQLSWEYTEKVKGRYDIYGQTKVFIDKADEGGYKLLFQCNYGNPLYGKAIEAPMNKENMDAFCNYVKAVVTALPQIKTVDIWNEPNLFSQFWGHRDAYAVEYAALVKAAALAIREVRDDITILGGVVSSSAGGGSDQYITRLMEQEIRPYVDGFSYHPYVNQKSVDWSYNGSWANSFTKPVENSGGWLDSYQSEMGYAIGTHNESFGSVNYTYNVDLKKQAEYLVKLYAYNAQMDVKETYWYNGRNVGTNTNYLEHMYGLMEKDFTPKPSYAALSQLSCRLNGGRYIGPVSFGSGIQGSLFNVNGTLTAVAWVPEKRDLSKPSQGCIDDTVTASYTFGNSNFVLRDMYGNEMSHGSTVTFTTSPVYLIGLDKSEAAKSVADAVSNIGAKYNISSGIKTITAPDWASATSANAAEYINKVYKVASSWIAGTGSGFTNRMKQADGFNKTAECIAAYYAYLYNEGTPSVSDAALSAANESLAKKCGEYDIHSMTFTAKMLDKAGDYIDRANEILNGENAKSKNGFAAADYIIANGLVTMANTAIKYENIDTSYGILVYTDPTYPSVSRFGNDGFTVTVDNQSGHKAEGELTVRDASENVVFEGGTVSLNNDESVTKSAVIDTDFNTPLGYNAYTVYIGGTAVKKLWINVTESTGEVIGFKGFADSDGNAVTIGSLPETVKATLYAANTDVTDAVLILAVYDGDSLKNIVKKDIKINAGTTDYDVEITGLTGGTRVLAMALDSESEIRPLCKAKILR